MYPNYSAPTARRASGPNPKLMIGVIVGIVLVLAAIGLIITSSNGGSGQAITRVVGRHEALLAMATAAQKNITGDELARINSDAVLFMTSDDAQLTALMKQEGIKTVPKEVASAEKDAGSDQRLSDAAAAGRFDASYKTVLSQKIVADQALLTATQSKVGSKSRATLKTVYEHLENIQQQLKNL